MTDNKKTVILVVDDNEAGRYSTVKMLVSEGFDVIEADTGNKALEMALNLPDLILLDVKLPDISGLDVCAELKSNKQTKSIPVVHLSATYVDGSSKARGLDSGADGYLVQPVERLELIATVNAMLRIKRAEAKASEISSHLNAVFNAITDAIFFIDNQFTISSCNEAFLAAVGRSKADIIGKHCHEILHHLDKEIPDCLFKAAIKSGKREIAELMWNDRHFRFSVDLVYDSSGSIFGSVHVMTDITELKTLLYEREDTIRKLEDSMSKVRILSGMLPICASCKKIRNDKGYWEEVSSYITEHSDALFTHGMCPDCAKKSYEEMENLKERMKK